MPTIAVANTKGGQGKTTLACALAAFLEGTILDANPENADAWHWAQQAGIPCQQVYADNLDQVLVEAYKSKQWSVIDCPPTANTETRAAIGISKLVVVPVGAGYQDIRGLGRMIDLIKEAKANGQTQPGLQVAIVGNGRRAVAFSEAWEQGLARYHHPKEGIHFVGIIPQRQGIVDGYFEGKPAFLVGEPAGSEVTKVLHALVALLKTK